MQILDTAARSICYNRCFFSGQPNTYGRISLSEDIVNQWSGHNVWGISWGSNQYNTLSDGNWHYQFAPKPSDGPSGNGCPAAYNPPQMYGNVYPSNSSSGGQLYSCDNDTGSSCQLGS